MPKPEVDSWVWIVNFPPNFQNVSISECLDIGDLKNVVFLDVLNFDPKLKVKMSKIGPNCNLKSFTDTINIKIKF
jgi:hypothetical protein